MNYRVPPVLQTSRATTELFILLYGPCPRLLVKQDSQELCQRSRRRAYLGMSWLAKTASSGARVKLFAVQTPSVVPMYRKPQLKLKNGVAVISLEVS